MAKTSEVHFQAKMTTLAPQINPRILSRKISCETMRIKSQARNSFCKKIKIIATPNKTTIAETISLKSIAQKSSRSKTLYPLTFL